MNTLTNLIPDLYAALHVVSRELVGYIPSITLDAGLSRAAVGQTVRIPIAPAAAAEDVVPGTNPPDTGDQIMDNTTFQITKSRAVPFRWTGEEVKGLSHGPGQLTLKQQQIAQAFRTLVNEFESDIAMTYKRASRAYGTAGTAPFATTIADLAQARKILVDNGCPESDLNLVMDTNAGVNMRSLTNLFKANEAGGSTMLRQGVLLDLYGVAVRESAQVKLHTKGTANSSYDTNLGAPLAVGAKDIAVDTGSGTIVAGDVITFAGDTNNYVVGTALAAGSLSINEPGLLATLADGVDLTLGNSYRANMLFHRSAIVAATRPPALPEEGDMAADRMLITDPHTGMTFEIAMYLQYRRVRYEISLAWGVAGINSRHICILRG